MNSGSGDAAAIPAAGASANLAGAAEDLAGLEPVKTLKSRWPMVLAGLLTAAMVFGLARQLLGAGLAGLSEAIPTSPLFYIVFAAIYAWPQLGDFIIFRRLWNVPADAIVALTKKRIANDVVFGYSGDAYFYAWARQRSQMVAAPFGAVKDVSIMSAMAGNLMTLLSTLCALPYAYRALEPGYFRMLETSIPIVILMCLPFIIFSRRVFSLDAKTLRWIFSIQCARLIGGIVLTAWLWHIALPDVGLGVWLIVSALKMLVSRLPFIPNKDLTFATVAIALLGSGNQLSNLMAFTAALTLLVHVVLAAGFTLHGLVRRRF